MELDKVTHQFKPNSYFENAIRLYYFDKELRGIIFDAIQSIEIALRSKITNLVSLKYGAFWFMEPTLFKDNIIFNQCLSLVKNEILRSKEDFISEHYKKYTKTLNKLVLFKNNIIKYYIYQFIKRLNTL